MMMRQLFLVFLLLHGAAAAGNQSAAKPAAGDIPAKAKPAPAKPQAAQWKTLSGNAPLVIARGGFSGIFPESSQFAYQFALATSLKETVLLCDLQLTKDGAGICRSDLRLDNSTTISTVFPKRDATYSVNGQSLKGWFSLDFTMDELISNVTTIQNIFSRPSLFDGNLPVSSVQDISGFHPSRFWLNLQYGMFYKEHKLDPAKFILTALEKMDFDYISSPEIDFLKSLNGKLGQAKTKLIFRFQDEEEVEPSTNQTYSSILKNLATIKSFASGILVPKTYIWPVSKDMYLESATTLVTDAHNLGLEVHAYNFANDQPVSYNYSFDPTAEYLQFIDHSNFSVDGVLTDFPSTASAAVACLAHNKDSAASNKKRSLIITRNGASGVFAGCTDLAYQQAVKDGADIIDCSVQMSKDGVAFCLDSADLMGDTTAVDSFMSRSASVPEIQKNNGIFSFDLTWSEIESLKPLLANPLSSANLVRNPAAKNQGKFMTLAKFLDFAKNSTVSGILISIENAPYLASKKGLDIVNAVSSALINAIYDKQTTQKVLIQSDDTSVLSMFKNNSSYKRVFKVEETISDASKSAVDEIKKYADAVVVAKTSLISISNSFLTGFTAVIDKMHAANLSIYVSGLRNEFVSIPFDCFSDPLVEMATYATGLGVDGIITEYPATASAYFRSPCSDVEANLPFTILPVEPGSLLKEAQPEVLPPAQAPAPALDAGDIGDPPLPPVVKVSETAPVAAPASSPTHPSGQPAKAANAALCLLMVMLSFII
ncbi:glycerophosphodiester phosphodiesterase GDPDL7-like [Phoenix dactylifera]|uniref:glycerophosphodiester phosphodiesterase n=1 Tax=Phoenix dactylifera TaxID=42345 RepID=A0A8B7D1F0_PHODC|nr:glycerophosphodiester phosphodiesterase GDPDL7-like [Phoenix dactylifera]XP_038985886.1 glycerophosphodiester phosphodiesterase GDPDL7-like [Phoenix dactylifera]